jgi:putative transposase
MAERGVILTYAAVRYWCRKFGQIDANHLRRRHPRPGDKWHLHEGLCRHFWAMDEPDRQLWRLCS